MTTTTAEQQHRGAHVDHWQLNASPHLVHMPHHDMEKGLLYAGRVTTASVTGSPPEESHVKQDRCSKALCVTLAASLGLVAIGLLAVGPTAAASKNPAGFLPGVATPLQPGDDDAAQTAAPAGAGPLVPDENSEPEPVCGGHGRTAHQASFLVASGSCQVEPSSSDRCIRIPHDSSADCLILVRSDAQGEFEELLSLSFSAAVTGHPFLSHGHFLAVDSHQFSESGSVQIPVTSASVIHVTVPVSGVAVSNFCLDECVCDDGYTGSTVNDGHKQYCTQSSDPCDTVDCGDYGECHATCTERVDYVARSVNVTTAALNQATAEHSAATQATQRLCQQIDLNVTGAVNIARNALNDGVASASRNTNAYRNAVAETTRVSELCSQPQPPSDCSDELARASSSLQDALANKAQTDAAQIAAQAAVNAAELELVCSCDHTLVECSGHRLYGLREAASSAENETQRLDTQVSRLQVEVDVLAAEWVSADQSCESHHDSSQHPQCTCTDGRGGDHCELNLCQDVDCGAHGLCQVANGEPICACAGTYSGEHCEVDLCEGVDCGHGTCMKRPATDTRTDTAVCECEEHWTGGRPLHVPARRLNPPDKCDDPCSGYGEVVNGTCSCDEDHRGEHCENTCCSVISCTCSSGVCPTSYHGGSCDGCWCANFEGKQCKEHGSGSRYCIGLDPRASTCDESC